MVGTRRTFLIYTALAGVALATVPTSAKAGGNKEKSREELIQACKAPELPFNILEKINPDLSDAFFQIFGTEIENRLVVNKFLKESGVNSETELSESQKDALRVDLCHYRAVPDCLPIILALGYITRFGSKYLNPLLIPDSFSDKAKTGITSANTFTAQSLLFMAYFPTLLTHTRNLYADELKTHPEYNNNPNKISMARRFQLTMQGLVPIIKDLKKASIDLTKLPIDFTQRLTDKQINSYIDLMMHLAGYALSIQNINSGRFVLNIPRSAWINRGILSQYKGELVGRNKLMANTATNSISWTLLFGMSGVVQPIAKFLNLTPQGSSEIGSINIKQFMGDFIRTLIQLTGKKEATILMRKWFDQNLNSENRSKLWSYLEPYAKT